MRPAQQKVVIGLNQTHRRLLRYGSVAGRVFLLLLYSRPRNQIRSAQVRRTTLQPQSSHPWDFLTGTPNLGSPGPLPSNRSPLQSQTKFLRLPSLPSPILRPPASPLSPTSQSQTPPMMSLPSTPRFQILLMTIFLSTPRPQLRMKPSTLTTGTSKYCAGIRSSVSTLAPCHSTPLRFVGCLPRPIWLRQNRPMVVPVFFPQTHPKISPRSSR